MVKDYAYAASFDRKHLPSLYRMAREIRETHDIGMIENFLSVCQQKVDDHNPILEVGNSNIEFQQVVKSDDLVVTAGINQTLDIILGVSATRWQFMKAGIGTTAVDITQTALVLSGVPACDMSLSGWRQPAGMKLFFGALFGESIGNNTLQECGVFTLASGGIMLNRQMFSNAPLSHLPNAAFMIASVIEFCPVV